MAISMSIHWKPAISTRVARRLRAILESLPGRSFTVQRQKCASVRQRKAAQLILIAAIEPQQFRRRCFTNPRHRRLEIVSGWTLFLEEVRPSLIPTISASISCFPFCKFSSSLSVAPVLSRLVIGRGHRSLFCPYRPSQREHSRR